MEVLIALLALVGLIALVVAALAWLASKIPEQTPEEDLAAPYREGLHAAGRLQAMAQDLERQMYVEAARHLGARPAEEREGGS